MMSSIADGVMGDSLFMPFYRITLLLRCYAILPRSVDVCVQRLRRCLVEEQHNTVVGSNPTSHLISLSTRDFASRHERLVQQEASRTELLRKGGSESIRRLAGVSEGLIEEEKQCDSPLLEVMQPKDRNHVAKKSEFLTMSWTRFVRILDVQEDRAYDSTLLIMKSRPQRYCVHQQNPLLLLVLRLI